MNKKLLCLLLMSFFVLTLAGQQPKYTPKHFVSYYEKNGKQWNAIANYTEAGIKRDPGNLKEGNGTLILYK
jgi:hypothetical protein